MSEDQATPVNGSRPQASFIPFVGIEKLDGTIELRHHSLIRGFTTRKELTPQDGCVVLISGEPPITAKSSPINLSNQVRACAHWCGIREIHESAAIQQQMMEQQQGRILRPGLG